MTETGKQRGDQTSEILFQFGRSFDFDRRLFFAAVEINVAYCDALFHAGIVARAEAERIKGGLQALVKRAEFNRNFFEDGGAFDVHEFIENRLVQLIGESGAKLNIGRNKIDQSQTAFRLWLRVEIEELSKTLRDLQAILLTLGERNKQAMLPIRNGAGDWQIVLWAHWCLAYFEQFERDRERLDETWRRVNILPLGAANLTGTSIEIDREEIASALNFEGIAANSLDATLDADFAVEFVADCAALTIHLTRLADELKIYNSPEFDFIKFPENDSPSPKNSEVLEILRAQANRIFGNQAALLAIVKDAPRAPEKVLRETQKIIFETLDILKSNLRVLLIILIKVRLNEAAIERVAQNYAGENELSDYLIFRGATLLNARSAAAKIVDFAKAQNKKPSELNLDELRRFSDIINEDVFAALSLEQILAGKNQIGGTAPERVLEALNAARENLRREEN